MRRVLACPKNPFAGGIMLGVLLYWASTMNGDPLIDLDPGLGSLMALFAPTGPSALSFELA